MLSSEERWYYLERARTSLELAEKAQDPAIAGIHFDLFERYMERAEQPQHSSPMTTVVPRR